MTNEKGLFGWKQRWCSSNIALTTKKMITALSRDELFQVLLFLPVSDVIHHSQTNSLTYDSITSNRHLWAVLLERDFAHVTKYFPRQKLNSWLQSTNPKVSGQNCCDTMEDYARYFQFYQFPSNRVRDDHGASQIRSNILFVPSSLLNQAVMDALKNNSQLVIPQDGASDQQMGMDFTLLTMTSRQPKVTSNWTIQLWTIGQAPALFRAVSNACYHHSQCLVITVDPRHAWNDDTYSTAYSCSSYGSNSLSRALETLEESKPLLKLDPPKACKGVSIVGVGVWSEDAPISKQRFLKDCALVFDLVPLEYFELTCDNVHVMSDVILRRFYTFHQQAVAEALQSGFLSSQVTSKSRCVLS